MRPAASPMRLLRQANPRLDVRANHKARGASVPQACRVVSRPSSPFSSPSTARDAFTLEDPYVPLMSGVALRLNRVCLLLVPGRARHAR